MSRLQVLLLGGATVLIAATLFFSLLSSDGAARFAEACMAIDPGDPPSRAFDLLGQEHYRPGCGSELPCGSRDFGEHRALPFICDGDDCSLLFRAGEQGCLVELDEAAEEVLRAELLGMPGG